MAEGYKYIEDVELADVQIKWSFSNFDGREDRFGGNGHYFVMILPEETARELEKDGWAIKEYPGREEGDEPEYTLKAIISFKYEPPKIYFIKRGRKFRVEEERDLADITRAMTEQIDVVLTPSRWVQGQRSGITAYVREIYVKIRESRFAAEYADYEDA